MTQTVPPPPGFRLYQGGPHDGDLWSDGRGGVYEKIKSKTTNQKPCEHCEGRGWLGACTGGQFAYIGRMAMAGRLPMRECPKCEGSGHER